MEDKLKDQSLVKIASQAHIDDNQYSALLDVYVKETKKQEALDKER